MRRPSSFLLLAWTLRSVTGKSVGCLSTTTALALQELSVRDSSKKREYILCPNTRFNIGSLNYDNDLVYGQDMIPLRPNLHVKCGDSGLKSNNCTVNGGSVQVDGTHLFGIANTDVASVVLEGLTFVNATKYMVWLTKPGNVIFKGCEFRVRTLERNVSVRS
jgi:hypothetical protein